MLHEEESLQSQLRVGAKRKRFDCCDLGLVSPLSETFWQNMIVKSLETKEEYSLLFNEQVIHI